MSAGETGEFFSSFAAALLFALAWLGVTYAMRPLRRKLVASYGIGMSFWAVALAVAVRIG